MAQLGNMPSKQVHLRLAARKPFSFALWVKNPERHPVDITGCTFSIVMKRPPLSLTDTNDEDNLITSSAGAVVSPTVGYTRFDLQGTDLNHAPGEYPFAIVMTSAEGYTALIVDGTIELEENTEFASLVETYPGGNPPNTFEVMLRGMTTVEVVVGGMLPPGEFFMSLLERENLSELVERFLPLGEFGTAAFQDSTAFAPADAVVPPGGFTNRVLGKLSGADYHVGWLNIGSLGSGGGGIDATGIPDDHVPTSNGIDGWDWEPKFGDADSIPDGLTNVMMTVEERAKLESVDENASAAPSDWDAITGPAEILNKPTLGTAAAEDVEAFAEAAHIHRLIDLDGLEVGTAVPTGGVAGDFYVRIPS